MKTKKHIIEELEGIGNKIPLLTALIFILGYMGFNTFISIYNIPTQNTDISLIASIGLINITFLFIIYITSIKREPKMADALLLLGIFNLILNNPILLGSILGIYLIITSSFIEVILFNSKKKSFSTLRKEYLKRKKSRLFSQTLLPIIFSILIGIFIDVNFVVRMIVIYSILYLCHQFKTNTFRPSIVFYVAILMFPILTMNLFINSSEVNILGLNKLPAEIITTTDTLKTKIIYNDNNSYYVISEDLGTVKVLNRSEVKEIKISPHVSKTESGIDYIKKKFN